MDQPLSEKSALHCITEAEPDHSKTFFFLKVFFLIRKRKKRKEKEQKTLLFEHTCAYARWALIPRFLSVTRP